MPTSTLNPAIAHGGAIATAILKYGGSKADWLDLSTGINPLSASLPAISAQIWQALPDTDVMEQCLIAARGFYNIKTTTPFIAAPGVQALIQLLPQLRPDGKAAILAPTYGEYDHVFQTLGGGNRSADKWENLPGDKFAIIVNPNNPDGRIITPETLLELAGIMANKNGLLIVDEAFCDLTSELSVAAHAGRQGLLVLKSFGKFFGLAGVRLGFAAGHQDDIARLEQLLGPWAVSGPALAIGAACYSNPGLRAELTAAIKHNSKAQWQILADAGLNVVADTGLFHLVEHEAAKAIHEGLARQHILTRIFAGRPHWLRLGLCGNGHERARLASALEACLSTS
jgi:cobalamin biosynthetic protein CobC